MASQKVVSVRDGAAEPSLVNRNHLATGSTGKMVDYTEQKGAAEPSFQDNKNCECRFETALEKVRANQFGRPFPAKPSSTQRAYYCFENGYDSDKTPFVACGADVATSYVGTWFGSGRRVGRSPCGFESLHDALNYMDSKGLVAVLVRWQYPPIDANLN